MSHREPPLEQLPAGATRVPLEVDQIPVNFTDEQYLANVESALARGLPVIGGWSTPHKLKLLICGNGPSLEGSISRLKRQAAKGHKIVACNNAYAFLKKHKVPVWAQAVMDAKPETAKYVQHRDPILYLPSLMVAPETLDAIEGLDVLLWGRTHHNDATMQRALEIAGTRPVYFFGGGGTITLTMPWVGYALGFRQFELYGVDSCFKGARQYALPARVYTDIIKVFCGGREFWTSPQMADQAASFVTIMRSFDRLFPDATISIFGDGLIPHIVRQGGKLEREK